MDASRRMSDACLSDKITRCLGQTRVIVRRERFQLKSCKTTGIRPNVPIGQNYTVHLHELRPRGIINGFRQRESVCDAVTVDMYRFSYRCFFNRDEQVLHASVYQRRITTHV